MPVPVVSIAQMRQWEEATWAAGRTPGAVIDCVGERVARRASRWTAPGDRILVLAGKGHNGDDAQATADHFTDRQVELIRVQNPSADLATLQEALARRPRLLIDGLFGIGLSRPLEGHWQRIIHTVNESHLRVLALDLPSGLHADTGEALGAAIRADITVTLGAPKSGLLLTPAEPYVGRLEVEPDIGLVSCPLNGDVLWVLPEDFRHYPPQRADGSHKGHFGHLMAVAGSLGYHGAGVLAARAAQRAQPGLISLYTAPATYVPVASQLQAVMVHPWAPGAEWPARATAILAGPGLAAADLPSQLKADVARWWREAEVPLIVDASALDWLPPGPVRAGAIRVITPHPGEAARLLATSADSVQSDRPGAARRLSECYGGCWVVLKGRHTLIGRDRDSIWVNSSGNPFLAQGGSGDVLAGFIAGLLAQPALQAEAGAALRYAVWQHGAAADGLTACRRCWVVEELLDAMGNVAAR